MSLEKDLTDDFKRLNSLLSRIPKKESLITKIFTPRQVADFVVRTRESGHRWKFVKRISYNIAVVREVIIDSCARAGIKPESVIETGLQDAIYYGQNLCEPFDGVIRGHDLKDGRMMVNYSMDDESPDDLVRARFLAAVATHPEVKDPNIDNTWTSERNYITLKVRGLPDDKFDIEPNNYRVDVLNLALEVVKVYDRKLIGDYIEDAQHPFLVGLTEEIRRSKRQQLRQLIDNIEGLVKHQIGLLKVLGEVEERRALKLSKN